MSLSDQRGPLAGSRERDITMITRDGKRLLADIYRPNEIQTAPVLLRRNPYGNQTTTSPKHLTKIASREQVRRQRGETDQRESCWRALQEPDRLRKRPSLG